MNRYIPMPTILAAVLLSVGGMAVSGSAFACEEAEKLRLTDEVKTLAKKNAWTGVERKYAELVETRCELTIEAHLLGAQSAQNLGKTLERFNRLTAAEGQTADEARQATLAEIKAGYGRVEIRGSARRRAALVRESMPFAPDARKSIEYGQRVMEGTGSFDGMLPEGDYVVGEEAFTVVPGAEPLLITVGKVKGGGGGEKTKGEGFINWAGPIVMVGGGFFGSSAPSDPIYKSNAEADELIIGPSAGTQEAPCPDYLGNSQPDQNLAAEGENPRCSPTIRQPGDVGMFSTPAIDLTLGLELGLTYKAPEMGVVVMANYRRTFGDRLNQVTAFGGVVLRPGALRFTAGPTWGVVFGSGSGFVDWVDEGQSQNFRDNIQPSARYSGFGAGVGLAGSAGYTALDFGALQGLVELHGHWQRDNHRSYQGFGLRIGIVPKVQRFDD